MTLLTMCLGNNLLPEGLETGEYVLTGTAEINSLEPVWCVAYLGTEILGQQLGNGSYIANGIAQTVSFLICTTLNAYNHLMSTLNADENASDYILTCFSVPKIAVSNFLNSANAVENIPNCYAFISGNEYNQAPTIISFNSFPDYLDGYRPRNNKLRTYPYMYLGFNPANGSSKVYRYEDFTNRIPEFKVICEVNQNPTVVFIPQNYRGLSSDNLSDIGTMQGYPTLSSRSDYFNSWLAQNSQIINLQMQQEAFNTQMGMVNTGIQAVNSLVGNGMSMKEDNVASNVVGAVADVGGAIVNVYQQGQNYDYYVKQQMAQVEKQQLLPDQANMSSSNATLLGYGMQDKNVITMYSIKRQFAERIDKFYDMYGYLTNTVKVPNINNRPNWNYIKTIGANILGNIPERRLN